MAGDEASLRWPVSPSTFKKGANSGGLPDSPDRIQSRQKVGPESQQQQIEPDRGKRKTQRVKPAGDMAKRMIDKTAKQTMLSVAEMCERFAVWAAMCTIHEVAVSRVIDETKDC
jgi:hypothetical protein